MNREALTMEKQKLSKALSAMSQQTRSSNGSVSMCLEWSGTVRGEVNSGQARKMPLSSSRTRQIAYLQMSEDFSMSQRRHFSFTKETCHVVHGSVEYTRNGNSHTVSSGETYTITIDKDPYTMQSLKGAGCIIALSY